MHQLSDVMKNLGLRYNLCGITTDGAPALVGSNNGLIAKMKQDMEIANIDSSSLITCHCIIHQENLCAKSLCLTNVMSVVVTAINFIKGRALNNRQFRELLEESEAEHEDLVYYCEVRWLSRGRMLQRFFKLISEVKDFMKSKGKPIPQLSDKKWVADLALMVDIAEHLSDLNLKLQGRNQLVNVLFSHIKSFEGKLCLWESQLRRNNYSSFPAL